MYRVYTLTHRGKLAFAGRLVPTHGSSALTLGLCPGAAQPHSKADPVRQPPELPPAGRERWKAHGPAGSRPDLLVTQIFSGYRVVGAGKF